MKSYNKCAVCNRDLKDLKSVEMGVGKECQKKNLLNLSDKEKTTLRMGLKYRIMENEGISGFDLKVKNDFIEISFGDRARRIIDLSDFNGAEIEKAVTDELNDCIDNQDKDKEIKKTSNKIVIKSISKEKMLELIDKSKDAETDGIHMSWKSDNN